MDRTKIIVALVVFVALFVAGFALGRSRSMVQRSIDPPAPEIRHETGAVTLRRDPAVIPPPPLVTGEKRIRAVVLDLPALPSPEKLQLDITRKDDGSERVTARLENGETLGGIDIPTAPPLPVPREYTREIDLLGKAGPDGLKPGIGTAVMRKAWVARVEVFLNPAKRYAPDEIVLGGGIRW
jgi:hypothetical protein